MKIINLFARFQNPYNTNAWSVMRGHDFLGSFRTRALARQFVKEYTK